MPTVLCQKKVHGECVVESLGMVNMLVVCEDSNSHCSTVTCVEFWWRVECHRVDLALCCYPKAIFDRSRSCVTGACIYFPTLKPLIRQRKWCVKDSSIWLYKLTLWHDNVNDVLRIGLFDSTSWVSTQKVVTWITTHLSEAFLPACDYCFLPKSKTLKAPKPKTWKCMTSALLLPSLASNHHGLSVVTTLWVKHLLAH